jgi:sugar fermentation stimulation protein A
LSIPDCVPSVFQNRPNRFLMEAKFANGETIIAHVADPGRLEELLYTGNRVLVIPAPPGSNRKTKWSLTAAEDPTGWILVNTGYHRRIAEALLWGPHSPFEKTQELQAEVSAPSGNSRFDFLLNNKTWVEIKGCTLKSGREALFPDAPTARGVKHVQELTEMALAGIDTAVVFLVFVRDTDHFRTNRQTDPKFADALCRAVDAGVQLHAVQIEFDGRHLSYTGNLEVTCKAVYSR